MKRKLYKKLYLYFMEKYRATNNYGKDSVSIQLTDHAVIRYLERVEKVDITAIRSKILGENLHKRVKKLGDGKYPMEGFTVVIKNKRVHTVILPKGKYSELKY